MTRLLRSLWLIAASLAVVAAAEAADWSNWRGPARNGTSEETGLISGWSVDGENLLWRVDLVGRSTPVVFDGKVCANGRAGADQTRQEMVACFDAETGEKLWEYRFNVYNTSVPWTRVGWANLTADPETGYLYAQGVGGLFYCFDADTGEVIWWRSLIEEYGFMEGYGGRTQTPFIDEDRLVITFSNTSWGPETRPLHRLRAFDKRTGELLWVSQPAPSQSDKNTQSTPNVMVVDGRRLIVAGNGGGGIYAVEARTGEPVWGFQLSQRGINTSVVVDGTTVYAAHSEENIDEGTMGRVVAIDGTGSGDVTKTHELWRAPLGVGFSSPALHEGRLYVLDNSANLYALDAKTGEQIWELNVGRVGKASPVVADGKIFLTEVNGRVIVVEPGESEGKILDIEEIDVPGESRKAEIYGSTAIAYGRLYFTTEEGLYCLGDPEREFAVAASKAVFPAEDPAPADAPAARLRVTPYEVLLEPGESVTFTATAYDAKGRSLGTRTAVWGLDGLGGSINANGVYATGAEKRSEFGVVTAKVGDLAATARVRILERPPFSEDFENVEVGGQPDYELGYRMVWKVEERDGNKMLAKGPSPVKIDRHITFLGRPDLSDYTIQADLMGTRDGRRLPDLGLINRGYTLEMLGAYQQLQVRTWQAGLRIAHEVDFPWDPDVWYVMKLRVEESDGKALVRGKVWPRGGEEPAEWSITVEDPLPIRQGSPGLSAYSPTWIYMDNIEVTSNR